MNRRPTSTPDRRDEQSRGAALLEFAVVVPILLALVFGTIDYGMLFLRMASLRDATQSGARHAAVASFGSDSGCALTSVPAALGVRLVMCQTKARADMADKANIRVAVRIPTTYTKGERLLICTEYPLRSITKVFPINQTARVKSDVRIDQVSTLQPLATAEETAVDGSWSWCS